MKFSEMPYSRPDMEALAAATTQTLEAMKAAPNAAGQIAAYDAYEKKMQTAGTMQQIAYIRHTINTKDEFYNAENDYMDEIGPKLQELTHRVNTALLESPYREELEKHYGALMFKNLEIAARSFSPAIVELMQEENKLVSEYQNLYASATVEFDGKTMPLPLLGPYKQDPDRAVRKAAYEADAKFFDSHREELDTLYDKLVKVRDAQAKKMGLPNYIPLGYDRMGRNCYTAKDVAAFRDQIAEDMVPIVAKVKEAQRRRIGVEKLAFYDEPISFADGNAVPEGTPDEILAAGKKMYQELSPETAEFIDFMFENELFDVLSRDGKAPGGYCTEIADYKSPFIFSNFNATAGDVDVLTHEAGHAFEDYRAFKQELPSLLHSPTIEACECHSMSMEFLTAPWHHLFFGKQTDKYELGHCEDALVFIPYGCMVDEFQHKVYENPEMTPEQRNELWLSLEKKYRPWIDFDNLPFYSRGGGWQRQLHIYEVPLYYIDYCMAQTVAFQFWNLSRENYAEAWKRYMTFVDKAGTATFAELVESAGLKVPYHAGCIKEIGESISRWLEEHELG
ncbi:MAG: M3 family oligoendopeptidase [Clostridiales bacterium]|nr:M3 family oligoendopeptidase [Clostridiales bacterium]